MTKYNQRRRTRKTIKIGTMHLETQTYYHDTLNQGSPWTIGEVMAEVVGSEYIAQAIMVECGIDGRYIPMDLDLTGMDFEEMNADELFGFWAKFARTTDDDD